MACCPDGVVTLTDGWRVRGWAGGGWGVGGAGAVYGGRVAAGGLLAARHRPRLRLPPPPRPPPRPSHRACATARLVARHLPASGCPGCTAGGAGGRRRQGGAWAGGGGGGEGAGAAAAARAGAGAAGWARRGARTRGCTLWVGRKELMLGRGQGRERNRALPQGHVQVFGRWMRGGGKTGRGKRGRDASSQGGVGCSCCVWGGACAEERHCLLERWLGVPAPLAPQRSWVDKRERVRARARGRRRRRRAGRTGGGAGGEPDCRQHGPQPDAAALTRILRRQPRGAAYRSCVRVRPEKNGRGGAKGRSGRGRAGRGEEAG